jgi:hypothetical protein
VLSYKKLVDESVRVKNLKSNALSKAEREKLEVKRLKARAWS